MKNIILFLFISCNCLAQTDFNSDPNQIWRNIKRSYYYYNSSYSNYDFYYNFAPYDVRKKANIRGVKQTFTGKKGKSNTIVMEFNNKGMLTSTKNPKRNYEFKAEYLFDSLQVYSLTKSKKETVEIRRNFEKGKKTREEKNVDGKQDYLMLISYNPLGKVSETQVQQDKDEYKMLYEYTNEGKLLKNSYLKNGKIKRVWNYECKAQGALEASNKIEIISSKCEYREESSDGSYVLYERILREGKPYLKESKFTKDSVAYEVNDYVKDSILYRSWTRKGQLETTIFYKKGKPQYIYQHSHNEKGQTILSEHFKKNKKIYMHRNSYDEKGNLVLEERLSPKDMSIRSSHQRVFNADNTMQSEKVYRDGKLLYQFLFEYTY